MISGKHRLKSWLGHNTGVAHLRLGIPAQSAADLASALDVIARFEFAPPPRILITGSLYLAGEVLRANGTLPV